MQTRFSSSIEAIPRQAWQNLEGAQTPFTCQDFLAALESSGCVGRASGWEPMHLVQESQEGLQAAMPLYRKYHSYGEYVFDWRWAEAYYQIGLSYYPKLLCAVPFSPVPGPRLLTAAAADPRAHLASALDQLENRVAEEGLSGFHLLFPDAPTQQLLEDRGLLHKEAIQFHWHNRGYASFDDFLAAMRSGKRKQLRRERRRIADQGIEIERLSGAQISSADMAFFFQCYQDTYLKRSGHHGYLNLDFFQQLRERMADRMMLALARVAGEPIAAALFFHDDEALYGRYWGALDELDCLHFELCYYQGIDFCIERGLTSFNPGTQGEHKLIRGFEPVRTHSYHWLTHPEFREAVAQSLAREAAYNNAYEAAAREHLPFHRDA